MWYHFSVDTRCRFNVITTSYDVVRHRIDVETKSCVYRVMQVNKHEKHPWRSVILVSCRLKSATLLKVTPLHGYFSSFLNCRNDTKLRNASHIYLENLLKVDELKKGLSLKKLVLCETLLF